MGSINSATNASVGGVKPTRVRFWIVVMLFAVTAINYGDRATLSIAGAPMSSALGLDAIGMGYVFSAFSWAYVLGQLPGGWLLDKFGSKRVYFWSIFTFNNLYPVTGRDWLFKRHVGTGAAVYAALMVGLAESPSFPGNSRIVAACISGAGARYCGRYF